MSWKTFKYLKNDKYCIFLQLNFKIALNEISSFSMHIPVCSNSKKGLARHRSTLECFFKTTSRFIYDPYQEQKKNIVLCASKRVKAIICINHRERKPANKFGLFMLHIDNDAVGTNYHYITIHL